ncbi:MAG: hypothetical protein ACLFU8_13180 [Anaerolineales bacterium]
MKSRALPILSVDFQKEFTTPEGQWFNPGKSVPFCRGEPPHL